LEKVEILGDKRLRNDLKIEVNSGKSSQMRY
jgi:hypothetical protein